METWPRPLQTTHEWTALPARGMDASLPVPLVSGMRHARATPALTGVSPVPPISDQAPAPLLLTSVLKRHIEAVYAASDLVLDADRHLHKRPRTDGDATPRRLGSRTNPKHRRVVCSTVCSQSPLMQPILLLPRRRGGGRRWLRTRSGLSTVLAATRASRGSDGRRR